MKIAANVLGLCALCGSIAATPLSASCDSTPNDEKRELIGGLVGGAVDGLDEVVSGLLNTLHDALEAGDRDSVIRVLQKLTPARAPTSLDEASSVLDEIATASPSNIVEYNAQLIANGIMSGSVGDLFDYARGLISAENGSDNDNPDAPTPIYPSAGSCDAPYSTSESELRSAIYIPETFTYGNKPPVVLFPGTGVTGYISYKGNFIPLLTDSDWADPVWVNVPEYLNDDAQRNAEYAAYALNYIASLTQRNVSIIAWSQGNIDTQWAFKHWPSTRQVTSDHVAISADYKGTVLANVLDTTGVTNNPSVLQQEFGSNFITSLRSNDGDSGYVPTTSVYSGFLDQIVQPQHGTNASAYLLDARGVGVTNAEVQEVCTGQLAGTIYTHESMLANPLTFALAKDALTHDGPGKLSRLDLSQICSTFVTPGLGLDEFLMTENALLIAVLAIVLHLPKVFDEPPIMDYAQEASGAC